jgi:predicted negative regulator of RcsB-dependent stress response
MSANGLLLAALVIVPTVGLAAWAWWAMAQVEKELRSFTGFEGLSFDI